MTVLRLIGQMFRFGIVGGIAFGIDFGLLVLLTSVFHIHYLVSASISFTVALVFNYFASMRFVFMHRQGVSRVREFIIFAALSILGLGINDFIMWVGVTLGIDYRLVKFAASGIVMVYNFLTRKRLFEGRAEAS